MTKTNKKHAMLSYVDAVAWLADQDTHTDDLEDLTVRQRPATLFGAAAYAKPVEEVAGDVIEHRAQLRGLRLCEGCVDYQDAKGFTHDTCDTCSDCWQDVRHVPVTPLRHALTDNEKRAAMQATFFDDVLYTCPETGDG